MVNVKPVKLGKAERMSFAKIDEVIEMPNLIEVQKNSYQWFLNEGLKEVFKDVSGITSHTGTYVLDFIDYTLDVDHPNYSVKECKERDATYAAPLRVTATLTNTETGEIKKSNVFMGDFPLMTASGTFVINGAERVIVSQLVRSPGVYYKMEYDKTSKKIFSSTVIPNRGAWLEYENDLNDVFYVRIDKNRKIPITVFIRALGLGTNAQILEHFGEDERIRATLEKDPCHNTEEALLEVYKSKDRVNLLYLKMLRITCMVFSLTAEDMICQELAVINIIKSWELLQELQSKNWLNLLLTHAQVSLWLCLTML